MTPKEEAFNLVQHFFIDLNLRDYKKAKECAIYLSHCLVRETLDIERIKHWKSVVNEIEKL
jgi:hypothetical protein